MWETHPLSPWRCAARTGLLRGEDGAKRRVRGPLAAYSITGGPPSVPIAR